MKNTLLTDINHQETFHCLFANHESIAVQGYDKNRHVIYWNLACEKLYGYTAQQVLGKPYEMLIVPAQQQEGEQENHRAWLEKKAEIPAKEQLFIDKHSRQIQVYSSYLTLKDDQNNVIVYRFDIDITKQKSLESLIFHDEMLIRSIFTALPDLFFLMDADSTIREYHAGEKNELYLAPALFLGKKISAVLPTDIGDLFQENITVAMESAELTTFEYQLTFAEGIKDFEARIIRLPSGEQCIAIIRDVTEAKFADRALMNTNNLYRQMFEKSSAIKLVIDPQDAQLLDANQAAAKFYGYSIAALTSMRVTELNSESEFNVFADLKKAECGESSYFSIVHKLASGELRDVEVYSGPVIIGGKTLLFTIVHDVSDKKTAQIALLNTERQLRAFLDNTTAVIYMKDLKGRYLRINNRYEEIFNIRECDILHKTDFDLFPQQIAEQLVKTDAKVVANDKPIEIEETVPHQDGDHIYLSVKYPLKNPEGEIYALCGISTDITERKKSEQKLFHQAHFDRLTGMPNRHLALSRLAQMLRDAKRKNEKVGVLFLDLDDFKNINDSLGHEVGDQLLIKAASRLSYITNNDIFVGRLGGDEFIVLLSGLLTKDDALPVIGALLEQFREPFTIDGRRLILTASIGVSVYPDDGKSSTDLLRSADTAMYQAKNVGRNTYSYFTPDMNNDISRRLLIEEKLRGALERHEFEVYYQPQYEIKTNEVIGAEALLRWHNPELGDVSPVEFIPIAEHTGLIVELGKFVLKQALDFLTQWQKYHSKTLRMAVNLSPRQFRDPKLIGFIKTALAHTNILPNCLELEITEGVLMSGHAYITDALNQLHKLGIILSMDDFGTGYSSLSYLREYPFKVLKIDRCFVDGLTKGEADKELVIATIALAHALGLKVVAEGVETQQQFDLLKQLHCDFAQGYLLSKPMPRGRLLTMDRSKLQV